MALFVTVMSHHLIVDEITRRFGPGNPNQTTVRGKLDEKTGKYSNNYAAPKIVTLGYAFYQFSAVGSHLLPNARLMDLGYNTLIAIQSSAFLMTLFRKGLIRWYTHAFWYSVALALSWAVMYKHTQGAWFWIKVASGFYMRINYRMDKYQVWMLFAIFSLPTIENLITSQFNAYKDTINYDEYFSLKDIGLIPKVTA